MADKNDTYINITNDTLIDPLNGKGEMKISGAGKGGKNHSVQFGDLQSAMHRNLLFSKKEKDWYNSFFRFGWINPHDNDQISREFLFFTKPDLYIMDGTSLTTDSKLNSSLKDNPFFKDAFKRHRDALGQLQYSIKDSAGRQNPFMCILTNAVTSRMDLPGISSESQDSTPNVYGVSISYRSHSFKSDNGFDFSLSFTDSASLEIYTMVKAYDEYVRLNKMGQINTYDDTAKDLNADHKIITYRSYIVNKIIPEQFSIYKFLIGSDGETILYYAKATGVYFVDVPRSDFSDPPNDGFKYSVSFHANFVEDNNPMILEEFNAVTNANPGATSYANVYDTEEWGVNNEKVYCPCIRIANDARATGRGVGYDYRLKWTNQTRKGDNYSVTSKYYSPDTTLVTTLS